MTLVLPRRLELAGWRVWDGGHVVRLDGAGASPVTATAHQNYDGWAAYNERVGLKALGSYHSAEGAIDELHAAEADGLFSRLWRNPPPLPVRVGWHHQVIADRTATGLARDHWVHIGGMGVDLIPPDYAQGNRAVFVVSVDGAMLSDRGTAWPAGQRAVDYRRPRIFSDAVQAMRVAELVAGRLRGVRRDLLEDILDAVEDQFAE